MRRAFVTALCELALRDERVVLLTADLGFAFLEPFRERFPVRFFNVGVAEQNMIGLATGLAEDGFVPFTYTMAAFALPRAYEVVRNGPVAHRLPVRIVGVGSGFDYGANGATHWALDDLALARALGELDIFVPADAAQAHAAVLATAPVRGPIYIRLANEERGALPATADVFQPGAFLTLRPGGRDVRIVALGQAAFDALAAADLLSQSGVSAGVIVPASLRPFDIEGLLKALDGARLIVTLEHHATVGGLGSLVAEALAEADCTIRHMRSGVAAQDVAPGSPTHLRAAFRLDAPGLARRIEEALRRP